ncbi:hypothetical protein JW758_02495 [Candidatus Peregrinibacteria bacterium]|nr:hypothetical protein [Candidatus Peregrinibacteria bacterium]
MNIKKLFKVFAAFLLSSFLLTSCGGGDESPERVIEKFKENLTEIESADITTTIVMKGANVNETVDFDADLTIKFDRRDTDDRKADIKVVLSGLMETAGQVLSGDADLSLVTLAEEYFIRLDELKMTGENMDVIEPIFEKFGKKWLRIDPNFIPENIRELQQKDEATLAKEEELKELFIESKLINVNKEFGVETVNGQKVYHYGIGFNLEGVKDYVRKASIIDGRALTEPEVEEMSKSAANFKNTELWIGIDDYYLYKAVTDINGGAEGVDSNINVLLEGKDYNKKIEITAPEDVEDLDPLELLMTYSELSSGAEEVATEDDVLTEGATDESGVEVVIPEGDEVSDVDVIELLGEE